MNPRTRIPCTRPRTTSVLIGPLLALALATGCVTHSTRTTSWHHASAAQNYARRGYVESVQEIVHRQEGNPAGGALAGALIGGFLFGGRGPGALIGAAGGAAVGAAASQGVSETRTYQVLVRFDDGTYGMFVYRDAPPFPPGQVVMLLPDGYLVPSQ